MTTNLSSQGVLLTNYNCTYLPHIDQLVDANTTAKLCVHIDTSTSNVWKSQMLLQRHIIPCSLRIIGLYYFML